MGVYFILLSIIPVTIFFSRTVYLGRRKHPSGRERTGIVLVFMLLTIFMGFREGVGADYHTYIDIWREFTTGKISGRYGGVEPGYIALNLICGLIWNDPRMVFILVSIIINGFVIKTIYEQSSDRVLSLYIYITMGFFLNAMNVQRSFMAVAISFYASKYLVKKKFLSYAVFIVAASMFHKTALIMICVYILLVHCNKLFIMLTLSGGLLAAFVLRPLMIKLDIYTVYLVGENGFTDMRISWFNVMICVMLLMLYFIYRPKLEKISERNIIRVRMVWCALMIYIFLCSFGDAASRIGFFFTIYYVLLIPDIISCESRYQHILKIFIYCFCTLSMIYILITSVQTGNHFIPYHISGAILKGN